MSCPRLLLSAAARRELRARVDAYQNRLTARKMCLEVARLMRLGVCFPKHMIQLAAELAAEAAQCDARAVTH